MLTRKERMLLKTAGSLITRELLAGEEVGIYHFGKFYTTELEVSVRMHKPGENVTPDKPTKFVHVIRFRAWEKLKEKLHAMPTKKHVYQTPGITMAEMDEPLPFCPHCGDDFSHLLVNPKTCPACGMPPELEPNG